MFIYSLKTKFIVVVSILIIALFGIGGFLLLKEKSIELSYDIYRNSKNFAELTVEDIVLLDKNYLAQDSFLVFNREIKNVFKKNDDVNKISLVTYGGEILYDSEQEVTTQYSGEVRLVADEGMLTRVKSKNISFLTVSGVVVYIKNDADGNEYFVDANENSITGITDSDRIVDIVAPYGDKYAVVYSVTYENLQDRIRATEVRILILMLLGVVVAFFLSFYLASSVVKPVKDLELGALKIATGDFKQRVPVRRRDELGVLSEAFNKMAGDLEISTKALLYKERVAKELELAAKIQREILPKDRPVLAGFDLSGGLIPADEIGGDCYDFIHSPSGDFYSYIGDVTGHGVAAGLVSAVANALIYSSTEFTADTKDILINVNKILDVKTASNMFMTMVLMKIAKDGGVQYVSAGHNQILKFSAENHGKVDEMPGGGIALGMVADIGKVLNKVDVPMGSGDVIILYSDGIPEARNENGEMYGMPKFKRAVSNYCDLVTAEGIKNALLADVKEFMGNAVQLDDMTMVVVKKL
ncbi:MAG: SpoIIE family protein phosphatase [Candidatus Gracilibacteria bacterium]|jgi:serine phosphatase RsbU (regulator of sigma subunit)